MHNILKLLFLILALKFWPEVSGIDIPILSDIQDIIGLAHDVGDIASGNVPLMGLFTTTIDPVQAKLDGLSKQIQELATSFNLKLDNALSQILYSVPRETDFRVRMSTMGGYMARISFLFKVYQRISKSSSKFSEYSMHQFLDAATSMHNGDVIETLNQIHRLFTGGQDDDTQGSLFSVGAPIFMRMEVSSLCGRTKSRQQTLYDIYRTVVVTEIKGFLMTAYAYGMLGIYRNITFYEEIKRAEELLILRVSDYLKVTKKGLENVPRDVYVCDPPGHRSGKTFVEFSRAVQFVVVHESMISDESCHGYCHLIDTSTYHQDYYYRSEQPITRCEGRVNQCRDLYDTDICEMEGDEVRDRLLYVKSSELGEYGKSETCDYADKRSHLTSWLVGAIYCEPCLCHCVEEKNTSLAIRSFSLMPQVTDIDNNMVLTGLSFEKKGQMIHLQIEQGELIEDGRIKERSKGWVKLANVEYVSNLTDKGGFVRWEDGEPKQMVEGVDYTFINYNRRKIHLDDIVAVDDDMVVTGAKLKISAKDSNAIALSIRLTKFDFVTGKLITEPNYKYTGTTDTINTNILSVWLDDDMRNDLSYRGSRTRIDVSYKKDPLTSVGNIPSSETYSEITITHSSDRDNVGQTTIPYFDRERSGPTPRVALDGVGLYHRTNGESGGFIGFKTFTHDLAKYINPQIDRSMLRSGEWENILVGEGGQEVLTGIAFEKQDKLIHLQIKQRKLIKEGHIEKGCEKWVRLEEFSYVEDASWRGGFVRWDNNEKIEMKEGEDFAFINYDRRKIHLDDIKSLTNEYVVTGAKLQISHTDSNALALSIRLTRFNYTTGELMTQDDFRSAGRADKTNTKFHSVWLDEKFISVRRGRSGERTVIDVKNKKDPIKIYNNFPSSPDYSVITISHSNDRDDVGQSTIPYFDREISAPVPRVALDGLGLYHRSNPESGGFIGIKTFTRDISEYLNPEIDPNLMRNGELESIQAQNNKEQLD